MNPSENDKLVLEQVDDEWHTTTEITSASETSSSPEKQHRPRSVSSGGDSLSRKDRV